MFENLLISSTEIFLNCDVRLEITGFMQIDSTIKKLKINIDEDVCTFKGSNEFLLSFNVNQISNIKVNSTSIQIYIDSDLIISIKNL